MGVDDKMKQACEQYNWNPCEGPAPLASLGRGACPYMEEHHPFENNRQHWAASDFSVHRDDSPQRMEGTSAVLSAGTGRVPVSSLVPPCFCFKK